MQPQDCLIFSDWLLDQGEERAAVGLRRMVRDGKWPRVRRADQMRGNSLIPRVAAWWSTISESWEQILRDGRQVPHYILPSNLLPERLVWIELHTKTFWSKSVAIRNLTPTEVKNPVAAALEFGAHLFGGLPEETVVA